MGDGGVVREGIGEGGRFVMTGEGLAGGDHADDAGDAISVVQCFVRWRWCLHLLSTRWRDGSNGGGGGGGVD